MTQLGSFGGGHEFIHRVQAREVETARAIQESSLEHIDVEEAQSRPEG